MADGPLSTQAQIDNATGVFLNQLASDGETPTGLAEFDLNSPEDDPVDYGPYPINRMVLVTARGAGVLTAPSQVQGLAGNLAVVVQNSPSRMIRDGLLMHTGEWPGWNTSMPMPNSHGCTDR
jgi:hypothetical protein